MARSTGRGTTDGRARDQAWDEAGDRSVPPTLIGNSDPEVAGLSSAAAAAGAEPGARPRSAFGRAVGLAVLIVAVQALLVALFAWPALRTAPRNLPIIVAGPPAAATAAAGRLDAAHPGAFKVTTVADEATAVAALRERRAYAALVARAGGPALLVASAASPVVAQLLTQQAQVLASGARVAVTDVVPASAEDPRGAGFAAGMLPVILTSMLAGVLVVTVVRARWARLVGVVVYAVLAGLAGAAVLHYWLAVLPGSYASEARAVGLLALAVSGAVAGLGALLGRAGIALGVLLTFVVGNPLSAVASAPELLPEPWGRLGQLLPPGAGATLLRSTAFFSGAGGTEPTRTLTLWAAAGLVLLLAGRHGLRRHR